MAELEIVDGTVESFERAVALGVEIVIIHDEDEAGRERPFGVLRSEGIAAIGSARHSNRDVKKHAGRNGVRTELDVNCVRRVDIMEIIDRGSFLVSSNPQKGI